MLIAVGLVLGLIHGQNRAERAIRWGARKLHVGGDSAVAALRQVGTRMEELIDDKQLLKRVVFWAAANWLIDAASLWVFLRAFDQTLDADALIISFGLANVMAAIPLTPGGLGPVDATYIAALVGFQVAANDGRAGCGVLPDRPVVAADRHRGHLLRDAAHRTMEHRTTRAAGAAANARPRA